MQAPQAPQAPQSSAIGTPRSPRSRRNRPCDFCRIRKVACKISSPGIPCELCLAKHHACTFDEAPRKRRRPASGEQPVTMDFAVDAPGTSSFLFDTELLPPEPAPPPEMNLDGELDVDIHLFDFHPTASPVQQQLYPVTTPVSTSTRTDNNPTSPADPAIPRGRSQSPLMRFVGSSGDLDTHLLAHRQYDAQHLSVSRHTHIVYQRLQDLESALAEMKPPPLLTMCRDRSLPRGHEITDTNVVQDARQEVQQLLSPDTVARLAALFARFVHPYLPLISKRTLIAESASLFNSPALLCAIAATASHFVAYDDVLCLQSPSPLSAQRLYQLTWRLLQDDLATPRLSTIQVLILLLHRHLPDELSLEGSMDANIRGLLVSSTYSLGLNRDPGSWSTLPLSERRLRKCLWWTAWVTEKWMAFSDGMPSQYHRDEYNVSALEADDVSAMDEASTSAQPFLYLTMLTVILDDVTQSFFTLAASDHTSSSLSVSLELAKNLRLRLKMWSDGLPESLQPHGRRTAMVDADDSDDAELGGNFSLTLAYMTTQLAIYRALIRPVSLVALQCHAWNRSPVSLDIDLDAAEAVVEGALSNTRSLIGLLTKLTTAEWDAFWPGWSRHNFASISTLLLHLYLLTARFQAWPLSAPSSPHSPQSLFLANQFEKLQSLMPNFATS
ncbi:fungal-specific transcription factor domain-containing protein [Aspergillus karnatakaensis]|uniref:Zn(II)2Cys6 transcription factor n=1 Tax=Aspergillus karnatakaensis TaxID=1810916 RepID=UPI003CCCA27B